MFGCSSCGRSVPVDNRMMHSLVCGRHSAANSGAPRDISEEEVTIPTVSNIEPTMNSDTSSIEGDPDATTIRDTEIDMDIRDTGDTGDTGDTVDIASLMVECEYCHLEFGAAVLDEHSNNCGTRTDVCDRCMHYVRLRDFRRHLDSGCTHGATGSAMASALANDNHTLLPTGNAGSRRRNRNRNGNGNGISSRTRSPRAQRQQQYAQADAFGDDATTWATVGMAVGAVAAATAFSLMRQR